MGDAQADALWISSGLYQVTRRMPADQTGEVSYRVKSSGGEGAVRESERVVQLSDALEQHSDVLARIRRGLVRDPEATVAARNL